MDIGASVGPYAERIEALPDRFGFVELAVGEGELPLAEFDPEAVADRADAAGLGTVVHLPYRQPIATPVEAIDAATLSYLEDLLAAAAAAGADTAVAHPRARGAGHRTERLAGRMRELSARGEAHGVTVCFETTGHAGGVALDRLGELADRADAALCLDVGYAYLEAGADGIESLLSSHAGRVEHLHVHGARHRGDTHIPIGSGDVPWETVGGALAATVPEATATVEVFTDDAAHLADSADRFRAALGG